MLAGMNVVGAAGRLLEGRLSDRLGSRTGLIRLFAAATTLTLGAATALLGASGSLVVPVRLCAIRGRDLLGAGFAVVAAFPVAGIAVMRRLGR